jgi:hypothetical protein
LGRAAAATAPFNKSLRVNFALENQSINNLSYHLMGH